MSLSQLRVLLVEDHAFQRRLGVRLLADLGVQEVLEAANGIQALDMLRQQSRPIDVALIDLDLPVMDGVQLLQTLQAERLVHSVALVSAMDPAVRSSVGLLVRKGGLRLLGEIEKPLNLGKLAQLLGSYAEPPAETPINAKIEITKELLEQALSENQIEAYFQPQAELLNGRVVGVEALARWHHPSGVTVPATLFIDRLEAWGLSERLTTLMVQRCMHWWRVWSSDGLRPRISINISSCELADRSLPDRLAIAAAEVTMPPEKLVLEVTEGVALDDVVGEIGVLSRMRLKRFGVSIDDFGTGHSSISKLTQMPFTELKIDRSFVAGCPSDHRKRAAVEASLQLAKRLDLTTVAEGVELENEWEFLAENGCDFAQGWLIAKAVPGEQLAAAIRAWRS